MGEKTLAEIDFSYIRHLEAEIDRLKTRLKEIKAINDPVAKTNDSDFSNVSNRPECKIRITQTYEGVVEEADDGHAVVVYEVDGGIVEQTYLKHQFQDQRLPKVGARLAVYLTVVEVPQTSSQDHSEIEEMSSRDDFATSGRKPLNGPVEF